MSYLDQLKEQYQEAAEEANEQISMFINNQVHFFAQRGDKVITITEERCRTEGLYLDGVKNFLEEKGIETKRHDKPVGIFFTL